MTPADAAELLTLAAAFDRRTVGKADAVAWADALDGLHIGDCAEAIRAHFRDSTDYLMPVHVRKGVRKIRDERLRLAGNSEPDYDGNDVTAGLSAIRAHRRAIADGTVPTSRPLPPKPVGQLVAHRAQQMFTMPPPRSRP